MKVPFVEIDAAIDNWKSDSMYEASVEEGLLKKWIMDCVNRIITTEQLRHSVALLPVENFRASLPLGFKTVCQAAYNISATNRCSREQVVSWVSETWGNDCELELNLKCPECNEDSCDHCSPIVTMDVDRIWEQANPHVYSKYMSHFHSYGKTITEGSVACNIGGDTFKLMRPRTTQTFWNLPYHIDYCPNFTADTEVNYEVHPPHIEVNFEQGEILLSYFGQVLDDEGYPSVPNHPVVFQATNQAIREQLFNRLYEKNFEQKYERAVDRAMLLKEQYIARARNILDIPTADEWYNKIRSSWQRLYPDYGFSENLSRYRADRMGWRDESYDHGRR